MDSIFDWHLTGGGGGCLCEHGTWQVVVGVVYVNMAPGRWWIVYLNGTWQVVVGVVYVNMAPGRWWWGLSM